MGAHSGLIQSAESCGAPEEALDGGHHAHRVPRALVPRPLAQRAAVGALQRRQRDLCYCRHALLHLLLHIEAKAWSTHILQAQASVCCIVDTGTMCNMCMQALQEVRA